MLDVFRPISVPSVGTDVHHYYPQNPPYVHHHMHYSIPPTTPHSIHLSIGVNINNESYNFLKNITNISF